MNCYLIPATPAPLILPVECVAEIVAKPQITALDEARASWMRGHVTWQNQRLPVMSYSSLHNSALNEKRKRNPHLVVLNPVPEAVRKAYSGIVCYGVVTTIEVEESAELVDLPDGLDKRYVEAAVRIGEKIHIIPKLSSLAVAFSYF